MPEQPDFDFIMSSSKPRRQNLLAGNSPKQRAIVFGGGFVIAIALFMLANYFLNAGNRAASEKLIDLAAYQVILRDILAIGGEKARDSTIKNNAITARYTLDTDAKATSKLIEERGSKLPKNFSAKYASPTLITQLEESEKANSFDTEYTKVYNEKLASYRQKLVDIYPSLNDKEKAVIKGQSDHVKILLGLPLEEDQPQAEQTPAENDETQPTPGQ